MVIGDAARSAQLGDSPMTVSWYGDLSADEHVVPLSKLPQSDTDQAFVGKIASRWKRWWKRYSRHARVRSFNSYVEDIK